MNPHTVRKELEQVLEQIRHYVDKVVITGEGAAVFLTATRGQRGFELYRDKTVVVLDRAEGERLLGETEYPDYDQAIESALRWVADQQKLKQQ